MNQNCDVSALMTMAPEANLFQISQRQFERAVAYLPVYRSGLMDFFENPMRTITVHFPIEMDDGSVRTFTGYRVLHSRVRGPGKGGIRFHPDVTYDEVQALGFPQPGQGLQGQQKWLKASA